MVIVSGSLTDPDPSALRNNTYVVACEQKVMTCVAHVEQIGPRLVGRMDSPIVFPIKRWDQNEIVADDAVAGSMLCAKTTITIERKAQTLLWVSEPINQTQPMCKYADTSVRKYTIEDSPGWKKLGFKPTR
jgi:hypothetical protein